MANVVFILGAGASQEAGGPLMGNFLDIADSLWKTKNVGDNDESFARVSTAIDALQIVHSKAQLNLSNIESVFNALEMARILKKFPGPEGFSVEGAIEALKRLIACTLEQTIRFPISSSQIEPPRPYGQFAKLLKHLIDDAYPKRSVAVLTFNYDMAADYALYFNQLGPDYCLEGDKAQGIPLLKLHGSMNWAVCAKCGEVVPWHLQQFFQCVSYSFLKDYTDIPLMIWTNFTNFSHCDSPVKSLPFLVPPTWNKTDHHEQIQVVWERAARELTDAESIIIAGYSLPPTDGFFRTLYALGTAGGSPLKRIWVFDPDRSGAVESRFRELIGPGAADRFSYFPFVFSGALPPITQAFPARKR